MHYIACAEVEERLVQLRYRPISYLVQDDYIRKVVTLKKIQIFWHISLRDTETGQEYKTMIFDGGPPPPFPVSDKNLGDGNFYGKPPDFIAFMNWLQSAIK